MTHPVAYRGRFAPSPTGRLHLGSLVCALASWLDARAHDGLWLIRIEDIDPPRDIPGADLDILETLAAFGMTSDEPVLWQHDRNEAYAAALESLQTKGCVYGCACSRKEIAEAARVAGLPEGIYPGTCRNGTNGRTVRACRFKTDDEEIVFVDRRLGPYSQNVQKQTGDFVVKRADGLWAYQLAVVCDDAFQGITDIVRGEDLLDNTPRQIALQRALGFSTPRYLHIRLVTNDIGEKLSKQTRAAAVEADNALAVLAIAAEHLRLGAIKEKTLPSFLRTAVALWKEKFELF